MTAALILFGVSAAVAQSAVTGKIVDETGAPLIGASVTVPGTSQGVSTDVDGNFTLKTDAKEIEISYVGYVPTKKPVTGPNARLGIIQMEPDAVALQDVIVMQSVAVQRKTPVAVSTVSAEEISYKLGGQEFPEILKSTPGVYVTKDGGGFGDSKINMRGFQAANVAVMVNGVPVNDMEWGGVYWSNWAGLSDVTRSMQTQRGLGASKISSPSVGGSVNIVTNGIEAKDEFAAYGKDVAMQVAAANPSYVDEASVPAEVVAKEKEIMLAQMAQDPKTANKPEAVKQKMIEGKIKKFFKENCLVDQEFVKDSDLTVAQYTAKVAKDLGGDIKIVKFTRFQKGEGLEKRADDFAAEVASMVK